MNRAERRKKSKMFNTPEKQERLAKDMYIKARQICKEDYKKQTESNINTMLLAIRYTLHFSELTQFDNKRINEFMQDLIATFDGFTSGDYDKEEYSEQLRKDKIDI